jgi:alcohol dehydrogenase class IV
MSDIGLATTLPEVGICTEEDVQKIVSHVNTQRLENNPRRITKQAIEEILKRIF